jgi:hypothetical protein
LEKSFISESTKNANNFDNNQFSAGTTRSPAGINIFELCKYQTISTKQFVNLEPGESIADLYSFLSICLTQFPP